MSGNRVPPARAREVAGMRDGNLVQGRVEAVERIVARGVEVLRPENKGVALALPASVCRDAQRATREHREVHVLVALRVRLVEGAEQSKHVPKLVQATVIPVVSERVVVGQHGQGVHPEVRHEVVQSSCRPQGPGLLRMRTAHGEPLVVLDRDLQSVAAVARHIRPLVGREDAKVRAGPRSQSAVDVRERLCRQRRVRDEGELVVGVGGAVPVLQSVVNHLLHGRHEVRAVVARHSGHGQNHRTGHLLLTRRQLAVDKSPILLRGGVREEGLPNV
mmetsp:Transcript_17926/g.46400  ORF Transcript_17926/g.46400 Transcript_17926/m.46400 type:complete len:275 (-) Transcript_17926:322-1146(-)